MCYTLKNDGDYFEKRFLPYLEHSFPYYEEYWQLLIVPLTNRNRDEVSNLQLKRNLDPLLEDMCMAHYSVYYNLGFSYEFFNASNDLQTVFPAIFYHLSTATEMVERFLFTLAKIEAEVGRKREFFEKLDAESLKRKAEEYSKSSGSKSSGYEKDFEKFEKKGQSVNIRLHQIDDVLQEFWQRQVSDRVRDYKTWKTTVQHIRTYRNAMTHNPLLGRHVDKNGNLRIPQAKHLGKYTRWIDVIHNRDDSDFIPLKECITECQSSFVEKTNILWECLLPFVTNLSSEEEFQRMVNSPSSLPHPPEAQGLPRYNTAQSLPSKDDINIHIPSASGLTKT